MNTLWVISLIAMNAFVILTAVVAVKNIRMTSLLDKARKANEEGDKPQALQYLNKALKMSPKNFDIISHKAVVLRDMGEGYYNEAIENYNKALVLAENENMRATINYHLGVLYSNLNRYIEAKSCFKNAHSNENINDADFWNNYAILFYKMGDKHEALRCFEQALLVNPQLESAVKNRETLLTELGLGK